MEGDRNLSEEPSFAQTAFLICNSQPSSLHISSDTRIYLFTYLIGI